MIRRVKRYDRHSDSFGIAAVVGCLGFRFQLADWHCALKTSNANTGSVISLGLLVAGALYS